MDDSKQSDISKKLQIKPGKHWLIINAPANYLAALEPLPAGSVVNFEPAAQTDGIQLFVRTSRELKPGFEGIKELLKPDTILWVSYPKKGSRLNSDLEMMGSWDEAAKYGLGIVASASIDQTWTALRFRPVGQSKLSGMSNAAIKKNDYSTFIDPDKKILTLPDDLQSAVEIHPTALANFTALSYSNRKEYLLWVLTAKQAKTRAERVDKTVEKLLAGKKNPAEK